MTQLETELADALLEKALATVKGEVDPKWGFSFPEAYETLCRAAQIRNTVELTERAR